jgi:hypothetical protein
MTQKKVSICQRKIPPDRILKRSVKKGKQRIKINAYLAPKGLIEVNLTCRQLSSHHPSCTERQSDKMPKRPKGKVSLNGTILAYFKGKVLKYCFNSSN